MEKLELEHLSAYLPYGLYFIHDEEPVPYLLMQLNIFYDQKPMQVEGYNGESMGMFFLEGVTPGLRPMSDITKEIEHGREKFIPAIELSRSFVAIEFSGNELKVLDESRDNYYVIGSRQHGQLYQLKKKPERLEFWQIQKLLSWHFDVFGLIDKGLAIDINKPPKLFKK